MIHRFPFRLKRMKLSETPHCCWEVNGIKLSHELGSSCCKQRPKGNSTQIKTKSRLKLEQGLSPPFLEDTQTSKDQTLNSTRERVCFCFDARSSGL